MTYLIIPNTEMLLSVFSYKVSFCLCCGRTIYIKYLVLMHVPILNFS